MFRRGILDLLLLIGASVRSASAQGPAAITAAAWSAADGSDNRDGGTMADPMGTVNGDSTYVRYRTGGSPSFILDLTLDGATSVEGVSITVGESPDTEGEG